MPQISNTTTSLTMQRRTIALNGESREILPLGLGCWGMSDAYGRADRAESIATIRRAVDFGVCLLDTADVYGAGHNEELIAEAITGIRQRVVLASKFGFVGDEHGNPTVCGRPDHVRRACEASLKRLGTEVIDIYHLHRLDPEVAIEETVGAMADLVAEGKVRALGLSEVSAATLARAQRVHHIGFLQSEYSLFTKEVEQEVLPACRRSGTMLLAFSPLGRGMLGGAIGTGHRFEPGDYRATLPRFQGDNLAKNLAILGRIEAMAGDLAVTPGQLALAWLLHQGDDIIPLPGMKRPRHLLENLAALDLQLGPGELGELRAMTREIAGARHNEGNLRFIDR